MSAPIWLDLRRMNCFYAPSPSARHKSLLKSYLFSLKRGEKALCCLIIGDFWRLMDLGAEERAADVFHVLRLFLSAHPRAKCMA
jgi:hypothetical protein